MPQSPSFFVMRHGESLANRDGIVVSRPGTLALTECGLTARGREQAREGATASGLRPGTRIITSDFARARETAAIAASVLATAPPVVDARLRERDFGVHDGGPDTAYAGVWARDEAGLPPLDGVESPVSVAERIRRLLAELTSAPDERDILLVGHGDVLQIAETVFRGIDPFAHRGLTHLANAEIRRMPPYRPR